ncbi:MAG: hypothetical protein LBO04_03075 [Spirochaetaceae bacterium]|nr:hypothetical protein [Spirochaetaceae bacterium]
MKSVKKTLPFIAALCASAAILAGCASAPKTPAAAAAEVKPTQKTIVIDDKGATFGIPTPEWVTAYIMSGNLGVEKLPLYKDKYCFVVNYDDTSKDYAIAWVQNASGPQQIAQKVSTTVASSASNALSGEKGTGVESNLNAATEQLSNAAFNGATREADWWQIVKNSDTGKEECRAFALWLINKKQLDEQVAANLQNIVDNNSAMSAAERAIYADLIAQIRESGGINS